MQMFASADVCLVATIAKHCNGNISQQKAVGNEPETQPATTQHRLKPERAEVCETCFGICFQSAAVWTSFRDENLRSAFRRYSWVSSVSLTFSLALLQFMTWDRPVLWPMLPHSARNHTISLKPTTPSPKSSTEAHTFRKTKTQTTRHPKHSLTVKPWGEVSGSSKKGLISCRRVFGGHLPILQTLWVTLRGRPYLMVLPG